MVFLSFMSLPPIKEEAETPSRCATTHHEAFNVPLMIEMAATPALIFCTVTR